MAKRTPEEIRAQREAFMARRAAKAAGETPVPSSEEKAAGKPAETEAPAPAKKKRTPEEIKAQREALLAKRAARTAGEAPPPSPPAPPAEKPAAPAKPSPREEAPAEKPKPARPPRPVAKPGSVEEPADGAERTITRRELLNYAWLASIGLFAVETVGLSLWFAFPNFKEGQFGGAFPIGEAVNALPELNAGPKAYTDGKFWLVNLDTEGPDGEPKKGVMALYKVCTHLGCLYEWVSMTHRFECPCHGSKFALTGDYLAGPAGRSLDRFVIQAISPDGAVKETNADGEPLVIEGNEELIVDTGRRILGEPKTSAT